MTLAIPMVDIPARHDRQLGSLTATGKAPLPLEGVSVKARIIDRVAEVLVEQKFHNPFTEVIEAVYVFPLAGGCAVSSFEMQIGARVLKAAIEERGEARRQYAEALGQGKRAALLEQERDDVFTVQAGNIRPGDGIIVRLTYSERLAFFEDGRTELRLPLVVAPRYAGGHELPREQSGHGVEMDTSTVPDASRITPPRLAPGFDPRVSLKIEAELYGALRDLECSQHAVRSSSGPESARVELSREAEPLDRDFVLRWRLAMEKVTSQLLVHGGYAMLSLIPPAREGYLGTPRDVVFVVDRSGSMQGPKMASAARACALLLRTLGPRDRFTAIAFDNAVEWMPGGFVAADESGIGSGERWLRSIQARGGTELDEAMREAFVLTRSVGEGRVPVVVVLTDGEVGDESNVLRRLQKEVGEARVFTVGVDTAVNDGFLRRVAALGGGTSTFVEPGSRLEEALQAVSREIGAPLITDVRVEGEAFEAAPARVPDLFAGRASTAFFRFGGGRVNVTGRFADGTKYAETLEPREAPLAAIDHLWARARVVDLEDEFRATHAEKVKKEIIALSIRYTVLTRFTAFIVIDPEVVADGGKRRTVVQPVEMPAGWAGQQPLVMARGPMIPRTDMMTGPRAPARAPPPMAAAKTRSGGMARSMRFLGPPARKPAAEIATPAQIERVREALEAFVAAFKARKLEDLEAARMELMKALGDALVIATAVPLLQAFLRSAAVEIIGALKAGAAPSVFDKHEPALQAALDEARAPLGVKKPAGAFWEASI
ncbi:MAG: VIT and VWA domain-containing protein [Myxococcales bacterium]|nr:VIT and VWA domain-containing protein [Myxococcales bacterium]